ncbi:MAG: PorT family protein [Bacteroidales bacterium]|nr:PorT family protein [Bacteroidales bacterium]
MKKSILLALFTLISVVSFAQVTPVIKGGVNLSNYYGDDSSNFKTLLGIRLGGGLEYQINDMVSLQPTLYLSHKGAAVKGQDAHVNAWYLDMPLDVQLRFNVSDKTNFIVAAGPYIAYGIFGKQDATENEITVSVDTFGGEGGLRRFDAGLNFELGLEFGKYIVGGSYELGLVKPVGSYKLYNSNFSLNVGYKF